MLERLTAVLLAGALAAPASAATFDIDKAHSSVGFKVAHLMVSRVKGGFRDFEGSFEFEEGKPKSWSARAVIRANSIDTGSERRDNHLRSPDFFDVKNCPEIKFESRKVSEGEGKDRYKVEGELTMRCTTLPVVLDVEFLGAVEGPQGERRAGFSATGTINRMDFGVAWNKDTKHGGMVVGEEVGVSIEVEGVAREDEKE